MGHALGADLARGVQAGARASSSIHEENHTMADKAGTEVIVRRPHESVLARLKSKAELTQTFTGDNVAQELTAQAIDKMAEAETLDDILRQGEVGLDKAELYVNKPITIQDVQFAIAQEKYRDGGLGAFAIVNATLDNGEEVTFSVGAPNVVGALEIMQNKGFIPGSRCMLKGKETPNGTLLTLGFAK